MLSQPNLVERETPFQLFLGRDLLSDDQLRKLHEDAPTTELERIAVEDPEHEKQYRMNLISLVEDEAETRAARQLPASWRALLDDLRAPRFTSWLESGTGINLAGLSRSIGIYVHRNGDFLSVHKDKPTKAITAILYLNPEWPEEAGGQFQMFASGDVGRSPVDVIAPVGGQLLAFRPTDKSWHAVSEISHPAAVDRLTVQIEYWLTTELMGSAYRPSA
ncbi:2OG-Fe(II) oxygenase [Pseudonocardia phyllosphaerae]|uniref:2OG-Fe(II) oxygenase n=1 Tax=Pseudonocardia phyllosphaerae TaxID=3390502 RepID=UPI00397B297A